MGHSFAPTTAEYRLAQVPTYAEACTQEHAEEKILP